VADLFGNSRVVMTRIVPKAPHGPATKWRKPLLFTQAVRQEGPHPIYRRPPRQEKESSFSHINVDCHVFAMEPDISRDYLCGFVPEGIAQ